MNFLKLVTAILLISSTFTSILACTKSCLHGKVWESKTVSYSFVSESYNERGVLGNPLISPLGSKMSGISALKAKELVRKAAQVWSTFSGLKLIEKNDSKNVDIRIGERDHSGSCAGYGFFPGNRYINGDIHMDNSNRKWSESLFYRVLLHEMGHTLGMVHNEESRSIMYYRITSINEPCDLDIAHIQNIYGAPTPTVTNNGNSVSWQPAQFKNKNVPYYTSTVSCTSTSKGEAVTVKITSKSDLKQFSLKSGNNTLFSISTAEQSTFYANSSTSSISIAADYGNLKAWSPVLVMNTIIASK